MKYYLLVWIEFANLNSLVARLGYPFDIAWAGYVHGFGFMHGFLLGSCLD